MAQYRHGVYTQEKQTSLVTPSLAEAAMPVVVGVAPVHTLPNGTKIPVNEPKLCYSMTEFENYFGKPAEGDNPEDFKLWQTAEVYFDRYKVAPLVGINVFDPAKHLADGEAASQPDPSKVSASDIIGTTSAIGERSGLKLVDEIFSRFRLNPGLIMAPGFAKDPTVAMAIETSCNNIAGFFRACGLIEVSDEVEVYSEVPAWLNDNNLTDKDGNTICFYGDCLYNGIVEPGSAHLAGCIGGRDNEEGGVPYWSPSNYQLECEGLVHAGRELHLTAQEAAYLNSQGIVTGLNWIGGLRCWGDETTAYPGVTDVKEHQIPVRRMFTWIGNTLILTCWQFVSSPIRRRLIETVQDTVNYWLNGLVSRDYILAGRCEFEGADNNKLNLMDGIVRWHVYVTPPSAARELDFILEYEPDGLNNLFVSTGVE